MGFLSSIGPVMEFVNRVWDYFKGRPKKRLQEIRRELEKECRRAQLDGDLDALLLKRAEIAEIDRRLSVGEYY
jgi:hypothetical protein